MFSTTSVRLPIVRRFTICGDRRYLMPAMIWVLEVAAHGRRDPGAFWRPGPDAWRFPAVSGSCLITALSLRLPNSLHERARELARREGISINQLVSAALVEKMSALLTEEYLEARARRGSRGRFDAALAQVPDVEPDENDRLDEASDKRVASKSRRKRTRKRQARKRLRS